MDYKRRRILVVGILYILILSTTILFKIESQQQIQTVAVDLSSKTIVKEVSDSNDHYYAYIEDGYYKVYNDDTKELSVTYDNLAKQEPCLELQTDIESNYKVNISDLNCIAPDTYEADLKQSSYIVNSYINNGYMTDSYYKDQQSINYYMSKGESKLRFIITKDLLIMYETKEVNLISPKEYIKERSTTI